MDNVQNGPKLDVRGLGIPQGVLDRAKVMLIAALQEADVDEGEFRFDADGSCGHLQYHSLPHLEVQAAGQIALGIAVQLKATGRPEGAIKGMLRLPPSVDRHKLLIDMAPGIENFNKDGWKDALKEVPPGPPPERTSVVGNGHNQAASPVLPLVRPASVAPITPPINGSAVATTTTPSASVLSRSLHEDHARFLKRLLEGHVDGTFSGRGVVQVSRPFFPGKSKQWLGTGLLGELVGLGWIRHIGESLYQVEQSFVTKHGLMGMKLVPQPKYVRKKEKNNSKTGKDIPKPGEVSMLGVADLLRQRQTIDSQLLTKKQELEDVVVRAEQALAAARTELENFSQQLRELLGSGASQFLG